MTQTWMCGAFQPTPQRGVVRSVWWQPYRCTLPTGHPGDDHQAVVDGETWASWPKSDGKS